MSQEVLLVEDSTAQAAVYAAYLEAEHYHVRAVETGEEALEALAHRPPAAVLLDLQLPGMQGLDVLAAMRARGVHPPVIVITDHGSGDNIAEAMRLGAIDFVTKPFSRSRLQVTVANAIRHHQLAGLVDTLKDQFERDRFHGFIGGSLPMQSLYRIIESAASSRATVFITGESGAGKELCAAAIHAESPRRDGPFVAVNCAALPRDLMESEIFGHVKGAFTGAHRQRDGAASLADGGTLFLDEIGEMDLDLQSKLLRFVQTSQFQRVGSGELLSVDVRIVCATNRDPLEMVRLGRLREDLYYRLHVIPIPLPPLRERGEDVLLIARSFLSRFSQEEGRSFKRFTPETERLLLRHRWPGNVRELENVIRNTIVLHDGPEVTPQMLPPILIHGAPAAPLHESPHPPADAAPARLEPPQPSLAPAAPAAAVEVVAEAASPSATGPMPGGASTVIPLWQVERDAIEAAVAFYDGNIPKAAVALQISPSTIYRKRLSWPSDPTGVRADA